MPEHLGRTGLCVNDIRVIGTWAAVLGSAEAGLGDHVGQWGPVLGAGPLHQRDPDRAIVAAGDAIPDWSGGTRLAEGVKVFLDRWGRRGMARGAVVVVFSDGWERDQPEALGEQVRRLRAVAHRVVWVNPHRGRAGYEPVQGGIMAVLPHVDHFVAGHSLAAFEELTEVVARA